MCFEHVMASTLLVVVISHDVIICANKMCEIVTDVVYLFARATVFKIMGTVKATPSGVRCM